MTARDEMVLDPYRLRIVAEGTRTKGARGQGEPRTVRTYKRKEVLVPLRMRRADVATGAVEARVVDAGCERVMVSEDIMKERLELPEEATIRCQPCWRPGTRGSRRSSLAGHNSNRRNREKHSENHYASGAHGYRSLMPVGCGGVHE